MFENGILPDNFVVPNACKACGALKWTQFGKGVHGYAVKLALDDCVYVKSSLTDMYGKCGVLDDARKVFDHMPEKNVIAWNSMMVGYVQNGMNKEVIQLFCDMKEEGIEPTHVTISSLLSAAANMDGVEEGQQCHAVAIIHGLVLDNILGTSILNFYCKVGLIQNAEMIFERMIKKDEVTWNLLISGYVQHGLVDKAIYMCKLMRSENFRFDCVTLASIMAAAAFMKNLKLGKEAHGYCIRNTLDSDLVLVSTVVNMYAKCERIMDARKLFDSTTHKDLILWNTLMAAYAEYGHSGEALRLFYQMQLESVPPNVVSWNSIILGFLRNGQVGEAENLFSQMHSLDMNSNLITWTTMMSGFVQNGRNTDAILYFRKMQEAGMNPNIFSITTALTACANIASLRLGKSIHGYIVRHQRLYSIAVATSLVYMYAKCGNINQAERIFVTEWDRELGLPLYNAMISAYAFHGKAEEALRLYRSLERLSIKPDDITIMSILTACSHAGVVNKAEEIFSNMVSEHGMKPCLEHYGLMVEILARSGKLDKAFELVSEMPFEADARIVGSLLDSCKERENVKLAYYLSRRLVELEPNNPGNYVQWSNFCAAEGEWEEVSKVRESMKEKGIRKIPGCSWIQIGEEVHAFVASDNSHPRIYELQAILDLLRSEMCLDTESQLF